MSKKRRFGELDFARAIPLLFMPIVHCYEEFSWWEYLKPETTARGSILLFLCAFGPSIFMLILGMNIAFTSHNSPKELARRGLKTLVIGELLNLVRYFLPVLLLFLMGHEYPGEEEMEPAAQWLIDGLESSAMSDILIFAGFAFLFFALMRKLKVPAFGTILISLVLLSVHTLIMPDNNMESGILTELLGNFVHATEDSSFPLMAWLIYPSIGYTIGQYMLTVEEGKPMKRFYGKTVLISAVALVALCAGIYSFEMTFPAVAEAPINDGELPNFLLIAAAPANSNITELFNVLLDVAIAGVAIGALGLLYFAIERFASKAFLGFVNQLSRSIMVFYIIQWIFVGWMEYLMAPYVECETIGDGVMIAIALATTVLSLVLALPIKKALDDRRHRREAVKA